MVVGAVLGRVVQEVLLAAELPVVAVVALAVAVVVAVAVAVAPRLQGVVAVASELVLQLVHGGHGGGGVGGLEVALLTGGGHPVRRDLVRGLGPGACRVRGLPLGDLPPRHGDYNGDNCDEKATNCGGDDDE